jgi:TPR repeat protein
MQGIGGLIMFKGIGWVLLFLTMVAPAAAGENPDKDFIDAGRAHSAGDHQKAFTLLTKCAEAGHCGCMNSLANYYMQGKGTEKNLSKAIRWHKAAYETGIQCGPAGFYSALSLARIYDKGEGIGRDPKQARAWYQRALDLLENPDLSRRFGKERKAKITSKIQSRMAELK